MNDQSTEFHEFREDFDYCRRIALGHYENFPVGSILLPRAARPHFYSLYAFMRTADDLADEPKGTQVFGGLSTLPRTPEQRLQLLGEWRAQLDEIFSTGIPQHPVFRALRVTVRKFGLSREPLARLLDAFEFDAKADVKFNRFEDLRWYTRRSAEPVGELVLALFGYRDQERISWSDSICTALQLNNFLQDAKQDLANGRCYFPLEDLTRAGISDWRSLNSGETVSKVVLLGLERVKELLAAGAPLPESVDGRLKYELRAVMIEASKLVSKIGRMNGDTITSRPAISASDHALTLVQAMLPPRRRV